MITHRLVDLTTCADWAGRADAVLSIAELERAQRFRRSDDRDRYVVAHVGLRLMLADALGVAPAEVQIRSAPCARCGGLHGRPELPRSTGLYFSMSRSRDFAAYAVAAEPVGIDIEAVPSAAAADEMRMALHPTELQELDALPADERRWAMVRGWVRKEAALKATGHGLTVDPATVRVGLCTVPEHRPRIGDQTIRSIADLDAPAGYASALAIAEKANGCRLDTVPTTPDPASAVPTRAAPTRAGGGHP